MLSPEELCHASPSLYPTPITHSDNGVKFGSPNSPGPMGITTNACEFLVTSVPDTFLANTPYLYRVEEDWYIIIVPALLTVANLGPTQSRADQTQNVFKIVQPFNIFIYLSLSTNVLLLISYRIFSIRRNVAGIVSGGGAQISDDVTSKITTVIVESAAILSSYVFYILTDMVPPTIGLVFSYIIIRLESRPDSQFRTERHAQRALGDTKRVAGQITPKKGWFWGS
ncbi:hypothetical protein C8F04DRAFT_1267385 [Mycena alexandri]|uniref:Uncharacterized protein n=1 Tax=Mycena alexandri TaxID=1745969 RepID=A0AAD6WVT1_9AGAR|nr:hypothetical protein C8F04DRAFT_1267385 [Mycena alexandri]